jgi:hypothetical protein
MAGNDLILVLGHLGEALFNAARDLAIHELPIVIQRQR